MENITIYDNPGALTLSSLADRLAGIANAVIPFLIGLAFVIVLWGIFKYIRHAGDEEQVKAGRMYVVYGVIALFMMISFWGFVMIITKTLFG